MIRRPPRSTLLSSSAASDVYKRQVCLCTCVTRMCNGVGNVCVRAWCVCATVEGTYVYVHGVFVYVHGVYVYVHDAYMYVHDALFVNSVLNVHGCSILHTVDWAQSTN